LRSALARGLNILLAMGQGIGMDSLYEFWNVLSFHGLVARLVLILELTGGTTDPVFLGESSTNSGLDSVTARS